MKKYAYLLVISLLTGCVTFQTNTDSKPMPFTKILVVSKLARTSPNYLYEYIRGFPVEYEVCVVDVGPLSFGKPDSLIKAQATQCKSEVMLTLDVEQNLQGRSGKYYYNINDVLLVMSTLPDQKPFWKGLTSISALTTDALKPRAVVKQLLRDHIITGKIPPPQP